MQQRKASSLVVQFLWVLTAAASISACTQEYETPEIEQLSANGHSRQVAPFPGLDSLLSGAAPGKVLWTHGMCPHQPSWVTDRADLLAAELHANPPSVSLPPGSPTNEYSVDVPMHVGNRSLDATFLVWSPLIDPYRRNIAFDRPPNEPGGQFPWKRAKLNGELKSMLMDQCLVDAVVYSGKNGDQIRRETEKAVCRILGGNVPAGGSVCNFARGAVPEKVAFVTESLGSKILFDAIRKIWNDASAAGPAPIREAARRFSRVVGIYMAANQIPLLDQADAPAAIEGSAGLSPPVHPTLAVFENARKIDEEENHGVHLPPLVLVAFTDPNDLLSYRLIKDGIGITRLRLVDVAVSNDWAYFDYVERPDTAHCGYKENATVLKLIIHGYQGGDLPDLGPTKADNACLNG